MDPIPGQDLYAVLGVAEDATTEEILDAYAYRLRLNHPDLYPNDARVQRWAASLATARDVLTDPERRADYDAHRVSRPMVLEPHSLAGPPEWTEPAEPAPPAPEPAKSERPLTGTVYLTGEQAAAGCIFPWTYDADEGPVVRTLEIPTGTAHADTLEYPADVKDGIHLQPLLLHVVVEGAGEPSVIAFQESAPAMKRHPLVLGVAAASVLAVAIGLVLSLGIGGGGQPDDGTVLAVDDQLGDEPVAAPAPAPAPAPAAAGNPGQQAPKRTGGELLAAEVTNGKAEIRAMSAGTWVPQVSSLCAGPQQADLKNAGGRLGYPDGTPEQYTDSGLPAAGILAYHRALDTRFGGAAVLVEGTATAACPTPVMWVSLVDVPQATWAAVQEWCDGQQLPSQACTPRQITADLTQAAQFEQRTVGQAALEIPWFMSGQATAEKATFTDPDTGAAVRITFVGDPATLDEARADFGGGGDPVLSRDEPNGFTLSGFSGEGDIYYWRQYTTEAGAVDVVWTYPAANRETFDPAVVRAVRTFEAAA